MRRTTNSSPSNFLTWSGIITFLTSTRKSSSPFSPKPSHISTPTCSMRWQSRDIKLVPLASSSRLMRSNRKGWMFWWSWVSLSTRWSRMELMWVSSSRKFKRNLLNILPHLKSSSISIVSPGTIGTSPSLSEPSTKPSRNYSANFPIPSKPKADLLPLTQTTISSTLSTASRTKNSANSS